MEILALSFVSLTLTTLTVDAQLNPLGRFGKCIEEEIKTVDEYNLEGSWYLQYRPKNPDHAVHTCQAQYEHVTVNGILHSLLYFYNKGKSVNNPQHLKYRKNSAGKYTRKITVDDIAVPINMYIIDYEKETKSRVLYYCADYEGANPDIYNVQIATKEQVPANLDQVLAEGKVKLLAASPKFDVPLMKVEQSLGKCAPLVFSDVYSDKFSKG